MLKRILTVFALVMCSAMCLKAGDNATRHAEPGDEKGGAPHQFLVKQDQNVPVQNDPSSSNSSILSCDDEKEDIYLFACKDCR